VSHRNSLRVHGVVRRIKLGFHQEWRAKRKTSGNRRPKTSTTRRIGIGTELPDASSNPPVFNLRAKIRREIAQRSIIADA